MINYRLNIILALIYFNFVINPSLCEQPISVCLNDRPFRLSDSTCANFQDVCIKQGDEQCNNLLSACKQCPPSNFTIFMLSEIWKTVKNEINATRLNQREIELKLNGINATRLHLREIELKLKEINATILHEIELKLGGFNATRLHLREIELKLNGINATKLHEIELKSDDSNRMLISLLFIIISFIIISVVLSILFKFRKIEFRRKSRNTNNQVSSGQNGESSDPSNKILLNNVYSSITEDKSEIQSQREIINSIQMKMDQLLEIVNKLANERKKELEIEKGQREIINSTQIKMDQLLETVKKLVYERKKELEIEKDEKDILGLDDNTNKHPEAEMHTTESTGKCETNSEYIQEDANCAQISI